MWNSLKLSTSTNYKILEVNTVNSKYNNLIWQYHDYYSFKLGLDEARTLEAEARTLEAEDEATKFWPREASRPKKHCKIFHCHRVVPGSNFSDPTRPARVWTRPDPTSRANYLTRPDPCSVWPDPTRDPTPPPGQRFSRVQFSWLDPTHTIIYSFSAIVFVTRQLSPIILDGHMSPSCCPPVASLLRNCCAIATPSSTATWRQYDATLFPSVNPASVISV